MNSLPMRLSAKAGGCDVVTWSEAPLNATFQSCPWVDGELRAASNQTLGLVGAASGVLGSLELRSLEKLSEWLQARVLEQNQSEVKLRALDSEVKASKQLYETFLTRLKETKVQEDSQQPDARIINRATVPGAPFYPRKNLAILTALLASALLGVALALLLEYLDSGFRSLSQLEQTTGIGTLGIVPLVKQPILRNRPLHEVLLERPQWKAPSTATWAAIVYNAVLIFGFAHAAWFALARELPPIASTLSVMLIPVLGVFSGALWLGEVLHWQDWAAVALMVAAIAAVLSPAAPRTAAPAARPGRS